MKRQLPHHPQAERGVLGACLVAGRVIDEVDDMLLAEDFYDPRHQTVYSALQWLKDRGLPVDVPHVIEAQRGNQAKASASFITELIDESVGSARAPFFAQIVRDRSLRRKVAIAAQEALCIARDGHGDAAEDVGRAERLVLEAAQERVTTDTFEHVGEIVPRVLDAFDARASSKQLPGISSGLFDLDRLLGGFQRGDLIVLAGRTSMGKTALGLNMLIEACRKGHHTLACSLEMTRQQIIERALCREMGINLNSARLGHLGSEALADLRLAGDRMSAFPLHIDDQAGAPISHIVARCRRLHAKGELELLVVDYLQMMTSPQRRGTFSREREVSEFSAGLKGIAKEFEIPVIALSQLNRAAETRPDHRPQLSDLRDSGSIEQDADVVMLLYRDEYYNRETSDRGIAEIIVAKQRNGPTGRVKVKFTPETQQFNNLTRREE